MKKYVWSLALLVGAMNVYAQQVLTLEDCRRLALSNNKQISIGQEEIRKAEAEKKVARTQYLPDFTLRGAYLYNPQSLSLLGEDQFLPIGTLMPDGSFGFTPDQISNEWTMINGNPLPLDASGQPFNPSTDPDKIQWKAHTILPKDAFELDIHHIYMGSISVVQPLFMGGKIVSYNRLAGYSKELAETMDDHERQHLSLEVDRAYWQSVSLVNKRQLAEQLVEMLQQMNHDLDAMIAEGVATRADGLSVKVKLNEAEMTLLQADNGLQLSKMNLAQICGLPLEDPITLHDELSPSIDTAFAQPSIDTDQAIQARPEMRSLTLAAKIYEEKEHIVRSEMLPTIALTGNYMLTNPSIGNGIEQKFGSRWNVGVVMNMPLFHFGEKHQKLRAAKAETRIRQLEQDEAREKINLQINQVQFRVAEAQKRVIAADNNKAAADENLRYAQLGFSEGVIPTSNLMEAQTAWFKAWTDLIDAQISLRIGLSEQQKALGITE